MKTPALLLFLLLISSSLLFTGIAQDPVPAPAKDMAAEQWVDSVFQQLSLEQQIGQLFMIPAYSNPDKNDRDFILRQIQQYHVGGVLFMQGEPERQIKLANLYQRASDVPLMMALDAEWGLSMRLKKTKGFPKNMTLGAIRDDSLLYDLGTEYARQLRRVGIHVNFAPVLDVNNNARNPVINYRSFGENKYNVARKGIMISHGMQHHGVLAVGKHFPGHGDTDTDSHHDLPLISHDRARLDTLELYPFMKAVEHGMGGIMVAHLYIPALDDTHQLPSTLSPKIVNTLIRDELNYRGLIITDGLNMAGVTKYHKPGELEVKAFKAGNDILIQSLNVPKATRLLKEGFESGELSMADLEQRVKRILMAKYKLGLSKTRNLILPEGDPGNYLRKPEAEILRKQLYESALTLAKNDSNLLPLKNLETLNIAYVQIGGRKGSSFEMNLKKYGAVHSFHLGRTFSPNEQLALFRRLQGFNVVIVGMFGLSTRASSNYGVTRQSLAFLKSLKEKGIPTALTLFGSPYSLKHFGGQEAILMAYEPANEAQQAAASAIFGGLRVDGSLPVTASDQFKEGQGIVIEQPIRFGYGIPEETGMDSRILHKVDSLALHYIDEGAMPGCAILVARQNKIVYEKGFGNTSKTREGVQIDPYYHTYDLASVTKVVTTTTLTMKLVEEGILDLDAPISKYLPELKGSNKAKLTIRRLMQHNAGLPSWRPFYRETFADPSHTKLNMRYYSFSPTDSHTVKIAPNLFSVPALQDSIWTWVRDMEVRNTKVVRYSDIGMILLGRILERTTGSTLEAYAAHRFYRSLGMSSTHFTPGLKGLAKRCPPAGVDNYWRNCTLKGFVHDETSAILGGQAGHAGLFSNIYDLAKLLFMYKNGGEYGGKQYFNDATIDYFTRQQLSYNRKGLGWDKPEIFPNRTNPVSELSSPDTYGHLGFTGTGIWVDPKYDLIYVFLSNRTHPKANNKILLRENVRSQIMDQLYQSILYYEEENGRLAMSEG